MNPRERLVAVSRGGSVDAAPWFVYSENAARETLSRFARKWNPDALIAANFSDGSELLAEFGAEGPAVIVEVWNPFGYAKETGENLSEAFHKSPREGEELLENFFAKSYAKASEALDAGCDGIFYRLFGATPFETTPMEYGGFFLEKDRALLESIVEARFNVLSIEGGEGVYLEFVHDLPCSALTWNEKESKLTPRKVREIHSGALACGWEGEHERLWEEFGCTGLVFFGRVENLDSYDFSKIKDAISQLRSPVHHD